MKESKEPKGTEKDFYELCDFRDAILKEFGENQWTSEQAFSKGITVRGVNQNELEKKLSDLDGCVFGHYKFTAEEDGYSFSNIKVEEGNEQKDDPEGRLLKVIFGDPGEQQRVGKLLMDLASSCSFLLEYKPELNADCDWYVAKVVFDYTDYDDNEVNIPLYGTGVTIIEALEDLKVAYNLAFKVFEHQTP